MKILPLCAAAAFLFCGCPQRAPEPAAAPPPPEKFTEWGAEFTPGERDFYFRGVRHWLSYPAAFEDGGGNFSPEDMVFTLLPLTQDSALARRRIRLVAVDPGHGGNDSGAIGASSREKQLNAAIAELVGRELTARGFTVQLTRTGDRTLPLTDRAAFAARSGADVFVSIHCNSAQNRATSGVETFAVTPRGTPDTNAPNPAAPALPPTAATPTGCDFAGDDFALASAIQIRLIAATGAVDRGVKRAHFRVLYYNTVPAALVECGFISNPDDEAKLNDPAWRRRIAAAIADGVADYAERVRPEK